MDWYRPNPLVSWHWHWQLQKEVITTVDVEIYDIDLFDSSDILIQQLKSDGRTVICYFSAGSYENWQIDANDFEQQDLGATLDGWESKKWLDIRSTEVKSIM